MKFKHALTCLAGLTLLAVSSATNASIIDARFNGTVNTQLNTTFAVGNAITGEFLYDTSLGRFLTFTVGGQAAAPGFVSTASVTPDLFSAIYQAQVSPVLGGSTNSTVAVDLEGINQWASNNAVALLLNASQLMSNLDTTLSNFSFFNANADGTNVHSLNATLTGIQVTASAVPEPSSIALVLIGLSAIGLRRARRSRD
jgi:hypothetical protein